MKFSWFLYGPLDDGNLISSSSAFSKPSLHIWKFLSHVWEKPDLKNFEHYLASKWNERNCTVVCTFFGIVFIWDWSETWPFPMLWPLLNFPNLLTYWMQHFNSIIFNIWNSSARIPSPPLALFIVVFPKAHLTSQSFPDGSEIKNLPAVQELQKMQVWSLTWEDPLEESTATQSSILAWRIPWILHSKGMEGPVLGTSRTLPCASLPSACSWVIYSSPLLFLAGSSILWDLVLNQGIKPWPPGSGSIES